LVPRFLCRPSALHKENSGFATPTSGLHISTFRGYQILFSIRNPYINRFEHQSIFYSFITILPSESGVTPDHCTIFPYTLSFRHFTFKHLSRDFEKTMITAMYHGRWFAYMILPCPKGEGGERNTCSFRSPWVTLPLNLFFPTHFVLFPSALIWAVDGTVGPAEYALYRLPCDLYVVYVCK
jgi:hypothetical protein